MIFRNMKKILIVFLVIVLCVFSFILGIVFNKNNIKNNANELEKKEHNSPEIVIEGVWKAKHIELGEENFGKEYYVVFLKGGKVYTIDEDGVRHGEYYDIGGSKEANFTLQIEDGLISLCKYENDDIKCDLYDFVEKLE